MLLACGLEVCQYVVRREAGKKKKAPKVRPRKEKPFLASVFLVCALRRCRGDCLSHFEALGETYKVKEMHSCFDCGFFLPCLLYCPFLFSFFTHPFPYRRQIQHGYPYLRPHTLANTFSRCFCSIFSLVYKDRQ